MTNLSLIAAVAKNNVIGLNNDLPWNLKLDLQWFKNVTKGKSIIMGRKTAESLKGPLSSRNNIVLSKNPNLILPPGFYIASNFNSAIFMANKLSQKWSNEVMIIGGSTLYREVLKNKVNKMYLTEIQQEFQGDTYFPNFDKGKYIERSRMRHNEKGIDFDFVIYEKK